MNNLLHIAKKIVKARLIRKEPVCIPVFQGSLLNNRTALITGGTSGIGYSIAEAFLNNGAEVVITGRSAERVESAVIKLQRASDKSLVHGLVLDNARPELFKAAFEEALLLAESGCIDILVNNAGIVCGGSFSGYSIDEYNSVFDVNLKGTFFLSQEAARYMKKNAIKGNILNIASSSSLRPAISPYSISKWGLRGLTSGLAKTLAPYGITVNGLAPGPTATPLLLGEDSLHLENNNVPAGRLIAPEEIANFSVVLTSEMGRMIVGDIVYMTGGSGITTFDDVSYDF